MKKTKSDGIIAVGGGSPIDAAKIVISFYKEETGILLKLISIPTTLSAAELTTGAGYTSKYLKFKKISMIWTCCCSFYLDEEGKKAGKKASDSGSSVLILDANLSLSTPNRLWLSSKINRFFFLV